MDPVVHFELPYADRQRITRFYQEVFGWQTEVFGGEDGDYVLATTARQDAVPDQPRGAINGGFFRRSAEMPGQHPSVVIAVRDIDAAMRAVSAAGGNVLGSPMEIPGVGRYVAFHDPEGNRLSLLQPQPRQGA